VNKHLSAIMFCTCMLLSQAAVATTLPDWLVQVDEQKHQQPEQMLQLLQQHHAELENLAPEVQANGYYQQAALMKALGRHQEQLEAAEQGLALLGKEASLLKVDLLYQLGFAREMQTDYPAALQHYLAGMTLAEQLENEKYLLLGQINHAAMLSLQNNDQQALALLKDTYQRAQQLNDEEVLAEVMAELGLLYTSLGYDEEAVSLLQQALAQYQQLGWPKNQITVLYNLARTYSYLDRYELALQTYNQMLQQSQQLQDHVNLYHAYSGLAIASMDAGQHDAALSYMDKAEQYLPLLQSSAHVATHYYEKALMYKKLQQVSLAQQQVLLAEQSLNKDGLREDVASRLAIWHLKAQLFAEQGEFEKAYHQLYDFVAEYQDMRNRENELAFEQIRAGFEHERQQQQTRLLQQDNELKALRLKQAERDRQVQFLWLAVLGCSTLVLLILLLWQLTRKRTHYTATGADVSGQTG
jgi:tetratricopeptide (TPR) repeat protein